MQFNGKHLIVLLSSVLMLSCTDIGSDKLAPQITAQGFTIEDSQEGEVGRFSQLKLRIESEAQIKKLYISERSYEVDLASTPERNHFPLFGIEKKTMSRTDVTLDFQNYINRKLNEPGQYVFEVEVTDKQDQTAKATLNIQVIKPKDAKTPIETGQFELQRQGKDMVTGGSPFGIVWKTIDEIKVKIQISKDKDGASKLSCFTVADYEQVSSKEALSDLIDNASDSSIIKFDTCQNAAAGQVVGIKNLGRYFLLNILNSNTNLSEIGTTVTLKGEYKF